MLHAAYLMPLLPLAGFVVLAAFGRRLGDPWAGWLGTATVLGSFVVACIVYAGLLARAAPDRSFTQTLFTWIPVGGLQVKAALLVDPLSMTMALFVTGVSSLIHLYSIGYMKGDPDYSKFFLYLNLFVASMLILVLADNLLFTFVGWEGVGVCSYWLVSFWFGRDSAASAGKKAFMYNRLADVGFLIAIFLVFAKTGTLDYTGIFSHLSLIGGGTGTAICLLLFVAAAGKSAQLPLFPWLADAMEGPTPVSALIHAATMVTAGVYLMCRISPMLSQAHDAQLVVASVGAATAFVAATIGCAQQDIKKVLAYSTVSQLGYMFLAVGIGAYEAAIFLMVAHAFFKALLFLGAGSVIHGLDDEQDLKRMGNLRRYMKLTFFTFGIGTLAIAGIPPLSGFFAKGDILDNAFARLPGVVGHRSRHRRAHRVLHDPAGGLGLLRRRPVARRVGRWPGRPRRGSRTTRRTVGDGTPAGGAGGARLRRRRACTCRGTRAGTPWAGWARCSARPCTTPISLRARSGRSGSSTPWSPSSAWVWPSPCGRARSSAPSSSRPCCSGRTSSTTSTTRSSRGRARPSPGSPPR